ncbi:MAG: glutamine-hydrolyzing GMP synthase, partial [Desulfomonilia bacterium]
MRELVAVLDFGSQYAQLISRRIRECGVYCEILPHDISCADLSALAPKAIVLSGGPASVLEEGHPGIDAGIFKLGTPVLGICYGLQLLADILGGKLERGVAREYGPASIEIDSSGGLFDGLHHQLDVWMSHGDHVSTPPEGFSILAHTRSCAVAAMGDGRRKIYGVQFHPEVVHTPKGIDILKNFLFGIAGCSGGWTMRGFIEESIKNIKVQVGNARVICGMSGGVDSAVVAALINKAIGSQMTAIFVDNGVLRRGESAEIRKTFT